AERLSSIEINSTFHGQKTPAAFLDWRGRTPEGFVFSVKAHRAATQAGGLKNPARPVANFLASGVLALQEKLGPVLWQLPPSVSFEPDVVEGFLDILPHSVAAAQRLIAEHATSAHDDGTPLAGGDHRI